MSDDTDLTARLDNLQRPAPRTDVVKRQLRLTLLDARASSRVGIALVCVPAGFVFGVILRYGFNIPVPGFAWLESGLAWVESRGNLAFLSPLVLVGAPLVALCINVLAVMHVRLDRAQRELMVTLKLRMMNLLIIAVAAFVVTLVFLHALSERAHHLQ